MGVFQNISENPEDELDILFELAQHSKLTDLNSDGIHLYKDIENTLTINKGLQFTKYLIKKKYFNKLLSIAQAGFLSNTPQIMLAQTSLDILKNEMLLAEGQRIKNRYMLLLGSGAVVSVLIAWMLYWILSQFTDISATLKYFNVWTGAMLGTWVSFGARKLIFKMDDLNILEKDHMTIYIRLPYVGFCALIFVLLLESNIFSFQIGDISSNKLSNTVEIQLLIGVIAGLLESKLGSNILEKVQALKVK